MEDKQEKVVTRKRTVNPNDRRVKKTNRALRDALIELLNSKRLNDITVKELTEKADINRSTFYFYYEDIYDMVDRFQEEIYEAFVENVVKPTTAMTCLEDYIEYIRRFFDFCRENKTQCEFVLRNDLNNRLIEKLRNVVLQNIPDSAKEYPTASPMHYLTVFAISGILGVVIDWMNDGMVADPVSMVEFIATTYFLGSRNAKEQNCLQKNRIL